ncbi:Hypothetical predicted protein [Mytilus galloprovincialis]|uniref:Uncharacterized protein n=1 Tax=Mytilus galloprovincialis TaxID=29158 RepID=A0A8B6EWJ3_MYTGA|nr:Hypothetical predicted protein [Mytilus galloprovincialis]
MHVAVRSQLPWKQDHDELPTKAVTRRRTENTVKRHTQNSDMLKKYGNIIQEQERSGFIERVDETAETQEKNTIFLIIQHRRNEAIRLSELFMTAVVASCLIHKVHIRSVRSDLSILKHLQHYNITTATLMERDFYVDNILTNLQNEDEANTYYKEARTMLKEAGFNVRSLTSNSENIRKLAKTENVLDTDINTKVLGMLWNSKSDDRMYQKCEIQLRDIEIDLSNRLCSVFISNCRYTKHLRKSGVLTTNDINTAVRSWILDCQKSSYSAEIKSLHDTRNKNTMTYPRIRQLGLFIDDDGIVGCNGRIHNAPISENTKFTYLYIPINHPLTKLIAIDTHERSLHSGLNATLTYVRQSY